MPVISDIPDAATLHTQLDAINRAIYALGAGAPVTQMTIGQPPVPPLGSREASPGPPVYSPPIMIILEPPISDPSTIAALITSLQVRADDITAQLVAQGYTDA